MTWAFFTTCVEMYQELARLVLRIMSLQGAMQSSRAAVPVIRLTALQPAYAISSLG